MSLSVCLGTNHGVKPIANSSHKLRHSIFLVRYSSFLLPLLPHKPLLLILKQNIKRR
jgi:hypothetical protein